jgi:hypothetical protein
VIWHLGGLGVHHLLDVLDFAVAGVDGFQRRGAEECASPPCSAFDSRSRAQSGSCCGRSGLLRSTIQLPMRWIGRSKRLLCAPIEHHTVDSISSYAIQTSFAGPSRQRHLPRQLRVSAGLQHLPPLLRCEKCSSFVQKAALNIPPTRRHGVLPQTIVERLRARLGPTTVPPSGSRSGCPVGPLSGRGEVPSRAPRGQAQLAAASVPERIQQIRRSSRSA